MRIFGKENLGEIPVSEAEVQAWLDKVLNLSGLESRREAYQKAYNIEDKIRTEKRRQQKQMDENFVERRKPEKT